MTSTGCLLLVLCMLQSIALLRTQNLEDTIGFPENIEDEDRKPADNRPAIQVPICGENELLYPGDQKDDWACDCKPAYLYSPADMKCYPAFERGPCKQREIFITRENSFIPVCELNVCPDGSVMNNYRRKKFSNPCIRLGAVCDVNDQRKYGVNATTMRVECLQPPVDRFGNPVIKGQTFNDTFGVNPRLGSSEDSSDSSTQTTTNTIDATHLLSERFGFTENIGGNTVSKIKLCLIGCKRYTEQKCYNIGTPGSRKYY